MEKKAAFSTIHAVDRAIDILCAFTSEETELGISELSSRLGMLKGTVYRVLRTLEEREFVTQNPQNQKYRLGLRLVALGSLVLNRLEIRSLALPYMQTLNVETRETVTLNIVDNEQRVCIQKMESPEVIRSFDQSVGGRNPLWIGSGGKLLLAYLPEPEREKILCKENKGATIMGTTIETEDLRKELTQIRVQGYAFVISERSIGSFGIAAPISNHEGAVVASLNLSGPESRLNELRFTFLKDRVLSTAGEISQRMGWKGS